MITSIGMVISMNISRAKPQTDKKILEPQISQIAQILDTKFHKDF